MTSNTSKPTKLCFVTVGATASFHDLLQSVLQPSFMKALSQHDFTHLLVQYGKDGQKLYNEFRSDYHVGAPDLHGVLVGGFEFREDGLHEEMRLAQADVLENRSGGMIISHAGSGTVVEVLRLGVPLVVVPNPTLQDNHQEELAQELQSAGYVVASDYRDIASAVGRAEALRARMLKWPPVYGEGQKPVQNVEDVVTEEMGFLD